MHGWREPHCFEKHDCMRVLHIGSRKLLETVENGNPHNLHVIEVMACPTGCIGGGGQPLHRGDTGILEKRKKALYTADAKNAIRKSHENPDLIRVYEEYLTGHKAHDLLHTTYAPR